MEKSSNDGQSTNGNHGSFNMARGADGGKLPLCGSWGWQQHHISQSVPLSWGVTANWGFRVAPE